MTEEQKKLKAERNKRYREKKKAAKLEKDLQSLIDPAPESAMQTPSNEKQQGQLLSDAAFSYYLGRQNRRK